MVASDPDTAGDPTGMNAISAKLLRRLLSSALAVGFLVLVAVSAATAYLVSRERESTAWVNHTYFVERHLSQIGVLLERTEAARRGYLLTHQDQYRRTYQEAATGLPRELGVVQGLTVDNAYQQQNCVEMAALLKDKLTAADAVIQQVEGGVRVDPSAMLQTDQLLVDRLRSLLERMIADENRLLHLRIDKQDQNADLLLAAVLASGVVLTLIAVGALLVVRRYAGDLDRSQKALETLNAGLEQAVADRTADLTRANDEIQRFAYIVSHDLRSPLVNVMGFTSELELALHPLQALLDDVKTAAPEVLTREVEVAVGADLPEAIGFIRSSTKKMDRLINAILKLSREGRRNLTPELVNVDALAQGVLDSLKHQAMDRGAVLQVEPPLPDLISDRLAVEQILSNLVENALKYLQPGRAGRIVVRGRQFGSRVVLEVEDNGRGVDPKDHERIFDLFRRSGVQDQPGEGIGLAHVRALVYRLGGAISVDSALDRGATFRLSLPAKIAREEKTRA